GQPAQGSQEDGRKLRIADAGAGLKGGHDMTNAAMHIARTGLDAQDMRMRVISNNLANVNTTGFKRDRASFETLAYQV
ncbi:hypothetical protein AN648_15135, partial [Listeria monocytogenes]